MIDLNKADIRERLASRITPLRGEGLGVLAIIAEALCEKAVYDVFGLDEDEDAEELKKKRVRLNGYKAGVQAFLETIRHLVEPEEQEEEEPSSPLLARPVGTISGLER